MRQDLRVLISYLVEYIDIRTLREAIAISLCKPLSILPFGMCNTARAWDAMTSMSDVIF